MRVSVVVPVYNAEDTLRELLVRLDDALSSVVDAFEVVLVDDGSSDSSWTIIDELAKSHAHVHGISLMRNFGQHRALLAGIRSANHEVIVTMDDDLQHRPEQVPVLLEALTESIDLVYGRPTSEEHGLLRSLSSRTVKAGLHVTLGVESARSISAFRAFRTRLSENWMNNADAFASVDVLLSWSTTRVVAVTVQMDVRRSGRSGYTFRKLARHSFDMVTGYSVAPLRLVTYLGFGFALLGTVMFVYVIARWAVSGSSVAGFTFIASAVSLFSGVQMLALGIIGEYLGRVHFRTMGRPAFTIRATTNASETSPGGM